LLFHKNYFRVNESTQNEQTKTAGKNELDERMEILDKNIFQSNSSVALHQFSLSFCLTMLS